jgi:hypothetical protein
MKRLLLILAVATATLSSCVKENLDENMKGNSLIASLKQIGTTRSTEQVKNMALDAMNLIMPGGATAPDFRCKSAK